MKEFTQHVPKSSEKLPLPTPIPEKIVNASLDVAKTLQEGKTVSDDQIHAVTDAVATEFTKDGPPLSEEQKKEFERAAKKSFTPQESEHTKSESVPKLDLSEYQDTFKYVYNLYGLNKHAAKLNFLEGIMLSKSIMTELAFPLLMGNVNKVMENPKGQQLLRIADNWKRVRGYQKPGIYMEAAKATFPIWGPVAGELSAVVLDGAARKAYEKQTMFIRQAINDRIANSVFMRDFEFIQDKSPAEILNIIDKGKQGTIDLINTTYTDILPKLTSIAAAAGSGFSIDMMGGLLGVLRLPILYATNKRVLQQVIGERHQELKQKDAIDTRIMTSLQSIEVVKASDTMENAIAELNKGIEERDTIAIESRKRLVRRDKAGDYMDLMFQMFIPAGLGYRKYTQLVGKDQTNFNPFAALEAFNTYNNISLAQSRAGGKASELIKAYSDKIQPALQDIKRMEDLLGPYDILDKPDGMQEQIRKPVDELPNFDIQVKNLNFKNILHNVTLDIPQGSFVTIKGPSGIGKTTFLRHLVGFYGAEKGALNYGGSDLSSVKKFGEHSIYTKLAYANQNPQYFENMSLRENLLMWTKKQVDDQKLTDVLHDLHLDHIADRLDSTVKHFSGGELRRIGIARALLKDPKVLFLDEPTANLDAESSKQVLQIIKDMRKNRPDMTVVAVTHDPDFEAIAERVVDFAEVNRPKDTHAESLGTRQVFYASAGSTSKS